MIGGKRFSIACKSETGAKVVFKKWYKTVSFFVYIFVQFHSVIAWIKSEMTRYLMTFQTTAFSKEIINSRLRIWLYQWRMRNWEVASVSATLRQQRGFRRSKRNSSTSKRSWQTCTSERATINRWLSTWMWKWRSSRNSWKRETTGEWNWNCKWKWSLMSDFFRFPRHQPIRTNESQFVAQSRSSNVYKLNSRAQRTQHDASRWASGTRSSPYFPRGETAQVSERKRSISRAADQVQGEGRGKAERGKRNVFEVSWTSRMLCSLSPSPCRANMSSAYH